MDSDPFGTIPTKGYLDQRLSEFAQDTKFSYSNVFYIQGALGAPVTCPDGTIEIMRHWLAKGCAGTSSYPCTKQSICETFSGWADKYNPEVAFSCSYYNYNASCGIVNTGNCVADINNNSDAVLCMFNNAPENVLFGLKHSIDDCENAGGAVETVEGNVKLCKFPYTKLTGNCRNFSCAWCSGDSCQDSCVCPAGWNAYKNWMTTSQQYIKSWLIAPGHDWANEGRASVSDVDCYGWLANVDYKGCY